MCVYAVCIKLSAAEMLKVFITAGIARFVNMTVASPKFLKG